MAINQRACRRGSELYLATSAKSIYCRESCSTVACIARRKKSSVIPDVPVRMLTAQVIDGWFARAAELLGVRPEVQLV
ncbi:hypothetical protein [uncultured Agrobacterium sp.]|uniref:hypothetical protein n=1 Tax=uncultured Agrobacterium sp. TaxID=157277 RepID=UPI0025F91ED2|nr:hypothetical protein [uncultured Agrobacterium sp.]